MGIQFTTSTPPSVLDLADKYSENPEHDWAQDYPDLDSMVTISLSWGHSLVGQAYRNNLMPESDETADLRTGATDAVGRGVTDYLIDVHEYALKLDNEHLWLGKSDKDWHRPLITIHRNVGKANVRKRSEEAAARRAQKYLDYKGRKGKGKGSSGGSQSSSWTGWSGWQG